VYRFLTMPNARTGTDRLRSSADSQKLNQNAKVRNINDALILRRLLSIKPTMTSFLKEAETAAAKWHDLQISPAELKNNRGRCSAAVWLSGRDRVQVCE
jgi:hypothetical protein